jgi:hypothetical protein
MNAPSVSPFSASSLPAPEAPSQAPFQALPVEQRPLLLLFASQTNGQSRRVEGFIAHVLQRRHNHESFRFRVVMQEERPDLFERFGVTDVPTILVIDKKQVACRLSGYVRPHEVEASLHPWLH